jgi:DNA-binding response OmpR family regulator
MQDGDWVGETTPVMGDGPCVIVAEDDPNLRNLVSNTLTVEGYDVLGAASGREAAEILENATRIAWSTEAIDLVIADVRMPQMTGLALLEMLRVAGWPIPFVLMTAFPDDEIRTLASVYDVPLLEKPFTLDELRRVVRAELVRIRPG